MIEHERKKQYFKKAPKFITTMVLESTVVCVDNSEWMRNGDFLPTRIQAQQDAVSIICNAKTRQNPENNVALMTSASLEVLCTLTSDVGRILSKLHHVQPKGKANFATGIKIAHLALKHRQGKNHRMRIVVFVGSPIDCSEKDLIKLGKKLKKEKVNVDVVALGEDVSTTEKLSQFIETLNGKEGTGSHLIVVPPGPNLTEALRTSPILQGEDGYTPAGDFGAGFDVDPNLDPELALALRVSMEEQRQRQDVETNKDGTTGGTTETPATTVSTTEDNMLMNAISSMSGTTGGGAQDVDYAGMTEDEQIALAIQMSMSESATPDVPTDTPSAMETDAAPSTEPMDEDQDYVAAMNDPAFLQHLVGSLPGVDPNSEAIQSALQALTGGQEQEGEKKEGDKDEKKQ